jgi:hypothetical protein
MTRSPVRRALDIIGDSPERSEKIERSVKMAIMFVARHRDIKRSTRYGIQTKQHKLAANDLVVALKALKEALYNSDLPQTLTLVHIRLGDEDGGRWRGLDAKHDIDFEGWHERVKAAVATQLNKERANPGAKYAFKAAKSLITKYATNSGRGRARSIQLLAGVLYGITDAKRAVSLFKHYR